MGRHLLIPRDTTTKPEKLSEPLYVGGYVDRSVLKLLYRDNGELRVRQHTAHYVSYHQFDKSNGDHVVALKQCRGSRHVRRVVEEPPWVMVEWSEYETREKGVEWLRGSGVPDWEADVSPLKRHFADTNDCTSPSPRIAYFDIETDSRVSFADKEKMRVLCWTLVAGSSFHDHGADPVVEGETMWSGMLQSDDDDSEEMLLDPLWTILKQFDVVAAWYGDGFDFPVIQARSKRLNLGVDMRRWRWLDSLDVFKEMNAHVAQTGDEKQSMALNAICQSVLGEGKHDFDAGKTWEEWSAGGERRDRLFRYNQQDTLLLAKLEKKTRYTALFATICAASNLFVETRNLGVHQQTDGFLLRLAKERNYHWPTKPRQTWGHEPYKGAFVMKAPERAGILKNIHVLDFSGMYPSIMLTWNMSPETVRAMPDDRPVAHCPLTETDFYVDQEGILTLALHHLRKMRKEWSDRKASLPPNTPEWLDAERWAMGYKVAANSIYGVTGLSVGRYYQPKVAEGTTQNGAWLIKSTISEASKRGIGVLYSDTDSAMASGDSEEVVKDFARWCNTELYPRLTRECGCRSNYIDIAYEKAYERIVFVGAKKYVAAMLHYKGKQATVDSKPEIKGMEFKRGDAVLVARRLQGECIDLLIKNRCEEPVRFEPIIDKYLDHVINEKLELDEIVLAKSLSKPIDDYTAQTPPEHVRVAKLLRDRGQDVSVGTKIRYLILDASQTGAMEVIPAEDWNGEVDRYGLWEKRVWPPTQRLLDSAFPHYDWSKYDKLRPKEHKPNKKSRPLPGQVALFGKDLGRVLRLVADQARGFNKESVKALKDILDMSPGGEVPVLVTIKLEDKGEVLLEVNRAVSVDAKLIRRLRSLLGEKGVVW